MNPELCVYTVNKQQLYAKVAGKSNRQIALLIHGWSSTWFAMSPLLPVFSKRFRAVAVDLPGYGQSPPFPRPQKATIAAYADLLADFLRQTTNQPAVLVGHSMGGMISLTMALHHPELIERLVLICPTISGHLSLRIRWTIQPIVMLERFPPADFLVSAIESQLVSWTDHLMRPISFAAETDITETNSDYIHLRTDARRPGQGRVRAECYWAMREGDLRHRLGQIDIPALAIWGLEDNTVPLSDASALHEEWPDINLRIIPNAGHWPHFEIPQVTRRYIEGFLGTPVNLLNLLSNL